MSVATWPSDWSNHLSDTSNCLLLYYSCFGSYESCYYDGYASSADCNPFAMFCSKSCANCCCSSSITSSSSCSKRSYIGPKSIPFSRFTWPPRPPTRVLSSKLTDATIRPLFSQDVDQFWSLGASKTLLPMRTNYGTI